MPCVLGLQMEGEAGRRPLGVFKCQLCALTAPYSYVGQKPPDTHSVVLLEESYIMKDPFTPDKDRFLVLGSRCSLCSQLVCVSPVGMQFILLQEILPPLCPGEHGRLPSGNPARLGEKESSIEEACQPAWLSDLSAARCGGGSGTSHGAPGPPGLCTRGRDGAVRELSWQPHPGAGRSSVCREQGPSLQQEGAREVGREGCRGAGLAHPRAPSMPRPQGGN
ncbi:cysteine-rich DPF motif domain-containing protein 1 isoform X1 [Vulpes vulpes]|uniref:Cysteine-rich DPF motif domain-containing protein 1 n=1 Tax=Vulpes vulpes TaxID=9627 RepID=A0ABM4Z7B1_VULVU